MMCFAILLHLQGYFSRKADLYLNPCSVIELVGTKCIKCNGLEQIRQSVQMLQSLTPLYT